MGLVGHGCRGFTKLPCLPATPARPCLLLYPPPRRLQESASSLEGRDAALLQQNMELVAQLQSVTAAYEEMQAQLAAAAATNGATAALAAFGATSERPVGMDEGWGMLLRSWLAALAALLSAMQTCSRRLPLLLLGACPLCRPLPPAPTPALLQI